MCSLLFCSHSGACSPLLPPCTTLGAVGGGVPYFAHSDLTLHIDHIIAVEEAEGIELELGRVLLAGMEVDKGLIFDASVREESPGQKDFNEKLGVNSL